MVIAEKQTTINFGNTKKVRKTQETCGDCIEHDRFWMCKINGKVMNPCYCAAGCRYFRPKQKLNM